MNQFFYPNPHAPSCPWHHAAEVVGAPNVKWCEVTLCSWVSEPANAWSSMAYILVGLSFLYIYRNHPAPLLRTLAKMNLLIGLFSFIYHASNLYLSQIFDFVGIFLELLMLIGINLARLRLLSYKTIMRFTLVGTILLVALLHFLYLQHLSFQFIVLVLAVLLFGSELYLFSQRKSAQQMHYFAAAISLCMVAISFSLLDVTRIFCDPHNHFLQGHALWHVLASLMFIGIFKHYEQVLGSEIKAYPTKNLN